MSQILRDLNKLAAKVGAPVVGKNISEQVRALSTFWDGTSHGANIAERVNELAHSNIGKGSDPVLHELGVRVNGTYKAEDDECDGFSKVVVSVPADTKQIRVTQNGVYNAVLEGKDGYSQVTVEVPPEDKVLYELNTDGVSISNNTLPSGGAAPGRIFATRCSINADGDVVIGDYNGDFTIGVRLLPYSFNCPIELETEFYNVQVNWTWSSIFNTHMLWNSSSGGWFSTVAMNSSNDPVMLSDSYGQVWSYAEDSSDVWAQLRPLTSLTKEHPAKLKYRWWYDASDDKPYKMSFYINDRLYGTISTDNTNVGAGLEVGLYEQTNKPVVPLTVHSYKITAKYSQSYADE